MAKHRVLVCAATVLACAVLAADARATADVTRIGDGITVASRLQPGAASDGDHGIVLENILFADVRIRQQAFGDPTITSNFCRVNPIFNDVVCAGALFDVSRYTITMGDGRDRVRVQQNRDQSPCPVNTPFWSVVVELGVGADTFDTVVAGAPRDCVGSGGTFSYTLDVDGSGGADTIDALSANAATLGGSFGDDVLRGTGSVDALSGGGGDDAMNARGGDDEMAGGSGRDTMSGADGADDMTGDGDSDTMSGDGGNDDLRGGSGRDTLAGGPGGDALDGDEGDDDLDGGQDRDALAGGEDEDTIRARDGLNDLVDCGAGAPDLAIVDLQDRVRNCEFVDNFAIDDGPPAAPLGVRARIGGRRLRLRLACPRDALVRCAGRLTVGARATRPLAAARYDIPLGARRRVSLRLTRAERALLRRRGQAVFTTREDGASRIGPRTALRVLEVG